MLQSATTRAIVENCRERRGEESTYSHTRRGSRKGESVKKSGYTTLENSVKRLRIKVKVLSPERLPGKMRIRT